MVAFAGAASADITLSGSAEMGVVGGDTIANTGVVTARDTQFHTDIDVTFTMSGTTDGGLTFGASVDLDESNDADAFTASSQGGETIFISGAFGTVTMGDTDGGFDWGMSEIPVGPGTIDDLEEGIGFNGNAGRDGTYDGQIVRYDNTFGAFGVAVSAEIDDTAGAAGGDPVLGLGLRYSVADFDLGFGYQTVSSAANVDTSVTGISVGTSLNGIEIGLMYSVKDASNQAEDETHVGIGFGYSVDAWSLGASYGAYENVSYVANNDVYSFALTAGYDLGGGASILAGVSSEDATIGGVSTDTSKMSLGLSMSF